MQKFTFRVDVLGDNSVDANSVREALADAADGFGQYAAVTPTGVESLSDQGLKVFAKRVLGISLATPKTKAPKAPKATVEVSDSVQA